MCLWHRLAVVNFGHEVIPSLTAESLAWPLSHNCFTRVLLSHSSRSSLRLSRTMLESKQAGVFTEYECPPDPISSLLSNMSTTRLRLLPTATARSHLTPFRNP